METYTYSHKCVNSNTRNETVRGSFDNIFTIFNNALILPGYLIIERLLYFSGLRIESLFYLKSHIIKEYALTLRDHLSISVLTF